MPLREGRGMIGAATIDRLTCSSPNMYDEGYKTKERARSCCEYWSFAPVCPRCLLPVKSKALSPLMVNDLLVALTLAGETLAGEALAGEEPAGETPAG